MTLITINIISSSDIYPYNSRNYYSNSKQLQNLKLLLVVIIVIQVVSSLVTLLGAGGLEVGTASGVTLQPGHDTVVVAAATVGLVGLLTGLDEDDGREAGPYKMSNKSGPE